MVPFRTFVKCFLITNKLLDTENVDVYKTYQPKISLGQIVEIQVLEVQKKNCFKILQKKVIMHIDFLF